MERSHALFVAEEIARLITDFEPLAIHSTDRICEVLIYGSVADDEQGTVGDIDLMVIDEGVFQQPNFPLNYIEKGDMRRSMSLHELLERLGYRWADVKDWIPGIDSVSVDVHTLPLRALEEPSYGRQVRELHHDPDFFSKAFSQLLRYDESVEEFERISLEFFEKRYHIDLSHLLRPHHMQPEQHIGRAS